MEKVWNRDTISELLIRNETAVERAILKLYSFQTNEEQRIGDTREYNNVGFTGVDAAIFSSFAKQLLRGHKLSNRQLEVCRKLDKKGHARLAKYWRQLLAKDGK